MSRLTVGYTACALAVAIVVALVSTASSAGWTNVRESSGTITAGCPFGLPDPAGDVDGDGLTDADEVVVGTDPCRADTDADGLLDVPSATHTGLNTNVSQDNCPVAPNPIQLNTDGDLVDLHPAKAFDDFTQPHSDASGDACDPDDDNDGLSDQEEATGAACSGISTDALLADTDGDRMLDGAECQLGVTSPIVANPQWSAGGLQRRLGWGC